MDFETLNYVAVLVAAIAAFVLGGIWYGPLFGKRWQAFMGLSDEDLQSKGHPAAIMACAFGLTLLQALVLALLMTPGTSVAAGFSNGILIGVGFVATAFGVNYLFSRHPIALWGIDAGFNILQFAVMGAVLGAMS